MLPIFHIFHLQSLQSIRKAAGVWGITDQRERSRLVVVVVFPSRQELTNTATHTNKNILYMKHSFSIRA